MAELTYLLKQQATQETSTVSTKAAVSNYTISWSDLTTAGFGNGDEVLIFARFNLSNSDQYIEIYADIKQGSSYAGATTLKDYVLECRRNSQTYEEGLLKKVTLTTNDNFYFGLATETATTTTAQVTDFQMLLLSATELGDNLIYDEETATDTDVQLSDGDVDGVSINLPTNGAADNYLVLGTMELVNDQTFSDSIIGCKLNCNSVESMELQRTSMTAAGERAWVMVGGIKAAPDDAVCKVQYFSPKASTSSDKTRTAIAAINLSAFVDEAIEVEEAAVTDISAGADVETATLTMTSTGNAAVFAQSVVNTVSLYHATTFELTHDSTEFLTNFGDSENTDPAPSSSPLEGFIPLTALGVASLASGARTIDLFVDGADSSQDSQHHSIIAFSLELVSSAPTIDTLGVTIDNPVEVTVTYNTDTAAGTSYVLIDDNTTRTDAQVVASGETFTITGSGAQSHTLEHVPGDSFYVHAVHVNDSNNSNVLDSTQQTMGSAYAGSQVFDGTAIASIPSDSILYLFDGTHTGSNNETILAVDATKSLTVNDFIGRLFYNVDQTGQATITSNTATQINFTGGLSAGDVDTNDAYRVITDAAIDDTMWFENTVVITSEAGSFDTYIQDDSTGLFRDHTTVNLTSTGLSDGTYDITLDADGGINLTPQVVDEDPPVLSSPQVTSITTTTATFSFETDTASEGIGYCVVDELITEPSVAQIQAGNDGGGASADFSDNTSVSSSPVSFSVTGLTPDTVYYAFGQQDDTAGNDSTVTTAVSFRTAAISAVPGGDVVGSVQTLIRDTGATLTITLTNDTWIAAGTGPIGTTAQSNAIVAGITSAQSETVGWNNEVRDALDNTDLVRTSDTVATLTIPATAGYVITADEVITATIPNAVLTTSTTDLVASSFTVKESATNRSAGRALWDEDEPKKKIKSIDKQNVARDDGFDSYDYEPFTDFGIDG